MELRQILTVALDQSIELGDLTLAKMIAKALDRLTLHERMESIRSI